MHVIVSIGIKVYNCCNMLKRIVNLWQKHLTEVSTYHSVSNNCLALQINWIHY